MRWVDLMVELLVGWMVFHEAGYWGHCSVVLWDLNETIGLVDCLVDMLGVQLVVRLVFLSGGERADHWAGAQDGVSVCALKLGNWNSEHWWAVMLL